MSAAQNPPAFPNIGNSAWSMNPTEGMTLRDWFAGQALAGTMTEGADLARANPEQRQRILKELCGILYEVADAMLSARGDA